jgi:hypothetical protein
MVGLIGIQKYSFRRKFIEYTHLLFRRGMTNNSGVAMQNKTINRICLTVILVGIGLLQSCSPARSISYAVPKATMVKNRYKSTAFLTGVANAFAKASIWSPASL